MKLCERCGEPAKTKGLCHKCYCRQYAIDNKDAIRARKIQYGLDNKEHIDEYQAKYRINNREIRLKQTKRYYEDNLDDRTLYFAKYREDNRDTLREKRKEYYDHVGRDAGGHARMSENKQCSQYLGIHVAERVLRNTFNDVTVMPMHNRGYDFVCNRGKKIDVKASTCNDTRGWRFHINKNKMAEFFLLLAFDNRDNLNPIHMWMIPADHINAYDRTSIKNTTVGRWRQYEMNINKVIDCCNAIKNIDGGGC